MRTPEFVAISARMWIAWGPPLVSGIQSQGSLIGDLAL